MPLSVCQKPSTHGLAAQSRTGGGLGGGGDEGGDEGGVMLRN